MSLQVPARNERLKALLRERILVIDGAMGSLLQSYRLDEAGFRGERFRDHDRPLQGNNDLLSLTRPDIIRAVHDAYLESGADIVETNTFTATAVSQADYGTEHLVYEINRESARIAREACDAAEVGDPSRPRFVAGSLGPTNKTATLSPHVDIHGEDVAWGQGPTVLKPVNSRRGRRPLERRRRSGARRPAADAGQSKSEGAGREPKARTGKARDTKSREAKDRDQPEGTVGGEPEKQDAKPEEGSGAKKGRRRRRRKRSGSGDAKADGPKPTSGSPPESPSGDGSAGGPSDSAGGEKSPSSRGRRRGRGRRR